MMNGQQKARANPRALDSYAICDRCGDLRNHSDLSFQTYYAGDALVKSGALVCPECLDVPFQNNRPVRVGPDPVPIQNPRPPAWAEQEGYTDPTIPNPWPD